jgi:TPR repeat protein/ATP-dependent protease ClpP protease subunit
MARLLVFLCALLALLASSSAQEASAADFTTASGCRDNHSDKSCTSIYINGEIEVGDGNKWKFFRETIKTPHAIVTLNSPGGSVPAGLVIAEDILNREYDTYFKEGMCNSMCAPIWLAGKTRYMSSGVALGFHQAGRKDIRGNTIQARGDSLFDYYAKLKLPEQTMRYFFSAGPNELAWVTVDKAIELGLGPEVWPEPKKPDVQTDPESACDAYAASDYDPQSKSAGISFDKIDVGLAVPACEAAVQKYPENSRLNFQLGRAYKRANNFDAAATQYRKAADQGLAPAQVSLGAIYETGQGGLRDYDEAIKWYYLAAKQGDALGKAGLDRLVEVSANGPTLSQAIHEIDEMKGKIVDAHTAQQSFDGLKYCGELNGTSFYSRLRDRVLNLEEYQRSLESLVKAKARNPAKQGPWTHEDAKERSEEVKRQAQEDKRKCELVQSLPKLEERLQELQAVAEKKQ